LRVYFNHVIVEKKKEYMTEKQLDNGAIAIDLDFHFPFDVKDRRITVDDIDKVVYEFLACLKDNVYQFGEDDAFSVFVMQKSKDLPIDDGSTPLNIASARGHIPVVTLLLEHGASVDLANDKGVTPLMSTSAKGHIPVVRLLLEHDADPHLTSNQGMNALHHAAYDDHPETCLVLIAHGSDPEVLTNAGYSAISHYGYFLRDNDPEDEDVNNPHTRPRLSPADKAERVALLRTARAAYLLQQLRDANWRRRYPFLQTLLSGGLRLSAAQRAEQAQVQAALDTSAAIPPIPRHTKKLNRAYLLRQILSCQCNEGVVRLVASFL
jgi:hypothetical protein